MARQTPGDQQSGRILSQPGREVDVVMFHLQKQQHVWRQGPRLRLTSHLYTTDVVCIPIFGVSCVFFSKKGLTASLHHTEKKSVPWNQLIIYQCSQPFHIIKNSVQDDKELPMEAIRPGWGVLGLVPFCSHQNSWFWILTPAQTGPALTRLSPSTIQNGFVWKWTAPTPEI